MDYTTFLVVMFLLVPVGILMISKPHFVWKIDHFLSVKGGEPSDFYLACTRLGGVVFLGISIILVIGSIVK